jgi:hypothetical protein
MQGRTAWSCLREGPATECTSNGTLSLFRHITSLHIAPAPSALPSIVPTVVQVLSASGAVVPMPTGTPPAPTIKGSTCANALQGVAYTVLMDSSGDIAAVTAVAFSEDVPLDATGRVSVQQSFSVKFRTMGNVVRHCC